MRPNTDCAKKKAAIHERKILTDRQLFSLKLLCLRCGQNFIIDQLIGLIKGFDHLGRFRMEIDFIQRFGFGRVPDSAFQDILVDACAVTKAGVGMAGGVGRIGGKLPGKLRFALTIFVVRIRLDADFLQERIEFAVTPVLLIPETAFSIGKERTIFHRGGIRMFKNRNAKVENGNDAVASGLGLAAADQISTGFRAVKIFVFEVQQLIDTTDIPALCEKFRNNLEAVLETIPEIVDTECKESVRAYVARKEPNLEAEIQKYEALVEDRHKYVELLKDIQDSDLERTAENDNKKREIKDLIHSLNGESLNECTKYCTSVLTVDEITRRIKSKGMQILRMTSSTTFMCTIIDLVQ